MKHLMVILFLISGSYSILHANELTKNNFYYDIQWGHLTVGHIVGSLATQNNNIKLTVKSQSDGTLSLLYNYESILIASSYKQNKIWRTNSYVVNSNIGSRKYYSKVFWNKEIKELQYEVDPPLDLNKVYDVPKSTLLNVVDPVTAIIRVMQRINNNKSCSEELRIFDGRRRYNLSIKELEKEYLVNDRPRSFSGNTFVCGVKIIPIGGHRIESKWKPETDKFSDIKIFFGGQEKGLGIPVRLHLNRWFGTITVRLLEGSP